MAGRALNRHHAARRNKRAVCPGGAGRARTDRTRVFSPTVCPLSWGNAQGAFHSVPVQGRQRPNNAGPLCWQPVAGAFRSGPERRRIQKRTPRLPMRRYNIPHGPRRLLRHRNGPGSGCGGGPATFEDQARASQHPPMQDNVAGGPHRNLARRDPEQHGRLAATPQRENAVRMSL